MFQLIKSQHVGGLTGFAIVKGTKRFEVSFGPMSASERQNASKKEFEANPASSTAEIAIYDVASGKHEGTFRHQSANDFTKLLEEY